jgi:hypothetical protein
MGKAQQVMKEREQQHCREHVTKERQSASLGRW